MDSAVERLEDRVAELERKLSQISDRPHSMMPIAPFDAMARTRVGGDHPVTVIGTVSTAEEPDCVRWLVKFVAGGEHIAEVVDEVWTGAVVA